MADTVTHYLESIPVERRDLLQQLIDTIHTVAPNAIESMDYRMPTYRSKDGWVSVANQKHYISLYTCSEDHIAEFKAKHPRIRCGKGCLNLKPRGALPLKDIKRVIEHALGLR
ncbi:iron chaperone [Coraliomargarita akajimensis]|uniref:YdhG-like domain-containing protein n=1 Tax=Coraliomargarita akajimensis (strain DSM 45221 / IAM 15411 / JCM 23193 / KCTC 12865 / 04OKA010-24) TaxID=583355 RepID=D5EQW0_CORAD|nr:DUF1801 domain-containing protein [Coraliomargarita akajimensis]ADE53953.1 Domain of unknown function DUF1801 [Coraliomargarita akajimensis DSM 45221]